MRHVLRTAGVTLALVLLWLTGTPRQPPRRSSPCLQEQRGTFPSYRKPYHLDSGVHAGVGTRTITAFQYTIREPGAPWLRLHFGGYNLGQRSYITITSLQDGSHQRLDARSIRQWRSSSAFFNGDAVVIELHVAPGERGVFFRVAELSVGEWAARSAVLPSAPLAPQDLCGADDRVLTTDPAVGRLIFNAGPDQEARCTGWISANGAILTAGHCADLNPFGAPDMIEFNVPLSSSDGTPRFADADDQYPIDPATYFRFQNNGAGDDWGVMAVAPNSNTGLLPVHAQGSFYRMALPGDRNPTTVRVTGYGIDDTPPERNRVLQTDSGDYLGETFENPARVSIEYLVDTMIGNSGSPVIDLGADPLVAIGIHTHGGCLPPDEGNRGTSFRHVNLQDAIALFPGGPTIYVDRDHPATTESGAFFRPYKTVGAAVLNASGGERISIVTGSYNETLTIDKAVILMAPVGVVTIGQ